jgi:hypothetical protein
MEVIQVFDRQASRSFYTVAGRFLFIEYFDRRLAQLVERLFAGWQLTPLSSPERPPEIEIKFFCNDRSPDIPPDLNQFDIADGGRCYTRGDDYYLEFSNSLMHLQQDAPVSARLWIKDGIAEAELARVTSFAVCAALRRFGLFDLHSAGVVDPDSGKGVLIVGPSGSGKSTLTSQLARAGWLYLSDDEVLLSMHAGEVEARGFRSFFALREAASAGSSVKSVFEPAGIFSSGRVSDVVPGWLLFSTISGEKQTRLRKLSQSETMTRLIRACPWATYDTAVAGANLELLSRLARQTTSFDLMAGGDLLEPGRAAELLTSVFKA